jgi:hypothetical protein
MSEPVVVEVLNWAKELVEEPVFYKGGVDKFLGSGKYEAFVPYEEPESVLKAGTLYFFLCLAVAGLRRTRRRTGRCSAFSLRNSYALTSRAAPLRRDMSGKR